jgi:hypothetical protein
VKQQQRVSICEIACLQVNELGHGNRFHATVRIFQLDFDFTQRLQQQQQQHSMRKCFWIFAFVFVSFFSEPA